ncbi:MAG: signal peptidase I [Dysgonamonadaceae bacterium]|nr:signal peptidase I [Dysgonamonadaceae bacterium]
MKISFRSILKNLFFFVKIIVIAIVLAVILRVFVFSSFKIPSYSMLPALDAGDYILVNKLALGGRVYKNFDFRKGGKVETKRLWGFREVKRNDVLVFNFPYIDDWVNMDFNFNVFYVKRCVAIPGDTFCIENGVYKVLNCPDTLGCYQNQVDNYQRFANDTNRVADECFPFDEEYNWTVLNFGPLYVPGKGNTLTIDARNIKLYRNLIVYETDKPVTVKNDTVYLGNEILRTYTFQKNYYFMTGDYVFDSRDSRYWGLLPEDHIVGKAAVIWKSEDMNTKTFRWERFFKIIK